MGSFGKRPLLKVKNCKMTQPPWVVQFGYV